MATALSLCTLFAACTQSTTPIEVADAWAPATPPNASVAAVYMHIEARAPDTLLGATTPIANTVELHESSHKNGMMKMRRVESLQIAPDRPARLAPSGTHFMLIGLKAPLTAGAKFPLTLRFARSGEIPLHIAVMAPTSDHEHH